MKQLFVILLLVVTSLSVAFACQSISFTDSSQGYSQALADYATCTTAHGTYNTGSEHSGGGLRMESPASTCTTLDVDVLVDRTDGIRNINLYLSYPANLLSYTGYTVGPLAGEGTNCIVLAGDSQTSGTIGISMACQGSVPSPPSFLQYTTLLTLHFVRAGGIFGDDIFYMSVPPTHPNWPEIVADSTTINPPGVYECPFVGTHGFNPPCFTCALQQNAVHVYPTGGGGGPCCRS